MIVFSEHAKERNRKRKIPEEWILETVRDPDKIISSFRDRKLRRKRFDDRLLEVVTKTEGSKITVVTQYFLEEENES